MEPIQIARTLINMALDMDYMDMADNVAEELHEIGAEITKLAAADSPLYYLLQTIAETNEPADLISRMEEN